LEETFLNVLQKNGACRCIFAIVRSINALRLSHSFQRKMGFTAHASRSAAFQSGTDCVVFMEVVYQKSIRHLSTTGKLKIPWLPINPYSSAFPDVADWRNDPDLLLLINRSRYQRCLGQRHCPASFSLTWRPPRDGLAANRWWCRL